MSELESLFAACLMRDVLYSVKVTRHRLAVWDLLTSSPAALWAAERLIPPYEALDSHLLVMESLAIVFLCMRRRLAMCRRAMHLGPSVKTRLKSY